MSSYLYRFTNNRQRGGSVPQHSSVWQRGLVLERGLSRQAAQLLPPLRTHCVSYQYCPCHPESHLVEQPLCPPWNRTFGITEDSFAGRATSCSYPSKAMIHNQSRQQPRAPTIEPGMRACAWVGMQGDRSAKTPYPHTPLKNIDIGDF